MASLTSIFQSNLAQRVISSIVLIPVVLGAVYFGDLAFEALIVAALGIGLSEWIALTSPTLRRRARVLAYAGLIATLTTGAALGALTGLVLALCVWLFVLLAAGRFPTSDRSGHFSRALWVAGGIPYLALSGLSILMIRAIPDTGLGWTIYLLLVVWGTDIGAYAAGRLIGGPKIWPQISPKKTWAGLIGGMASAAVIGYLVADVMEQDDFFLASGSAVLAVIAQAGDFFESHVKRRAGAKDSGHLIPGHGGVLDRVDGLLFAAVALALALWIGEGL